MYERKIYRCKLTVLSYIKEAEPCFMIIRWTSTRNLLPRQPRPTWCSKMVNKASYTNRRHAHLIFRSNIERNDLELQKLKLAHAALSPPDMPPKSRPRKRKPAVAL